MSFKNGMRPAIRGGAAGGLLEPLEMSVNALATRLGVPTSRLNDIVQERRRVTPDTAMRLERFCGGDARSWLNLQVAYDLRSTEMKRAKEIERVVEPLRRSA
jgi:antitoxin HigA-1